MILAGKQLIDPVGCVELAFYGVRGSEEAILFDCASFNCKREKTVRVLQCSVLQCCCFLVMLPCCCGRRCNESCACRAGGASMLCAFSSSLNVVLALIAADLHVHSLQILLALWASYVLCTGCLLAA